MSYKDHLLECLEQLTDKQLRTYIYLMAKDVVEMSTKDLSKKLNISLTTLRSSLAHLTQVELIQVDTSTTPRTYKANFQGGRRNLDENLEIGADIGAAPISSAPEISNSEGGRLGAAPVVEECHAQKLGYKPSSTMPGLYVDKDNFYFNPDGSLWEDFSLPSEEEMIKINSETKKEDSPNDALSTSLTKKPYTTSFDLKDLKKEKVPNDDAVNILSRRRDLFKYDKDKNELDEKDLVVLNKGQDGLKADELLIDSEIKETLTDLSQKKKQRSEQIDSDQPYTDIVTDIENSRQPTLEVTTELAKLMLEHIRSIGSASMLTWEPDGKKLILFTPKDDDRLILDVVSIVLQKGYEHRIFPTSEQDAWLETYMAMDRTAELQPINVPVKPRADWLEQLRLKARLEDKPLHEVLNEAIEEQDKKYAAVEHDFSLDKPGEPPSIFNPVIVKTKSNPTLAEKDPLSTGYGNVDAAIDAVDVFKDSIDKIDKEDLELAKAQKRLEELREKAREENISAAKWVWDMPEDDISEDIKRRMNKLMLERQMQELDKIPMENINHKFTEVKDAQSLPPFTPLKDSDLLGESQTEGEVSDIEPTAENKRDHLIAEMAQDLRGRSPNANISKTDLNKNKGDLSKNEEVLLDDRDDDYQEENGERSNEAKVYQYLEAGIDTKLETKSLIFFKKVVGAVSIRWDDFKQNIPIWYRDLGEKYILLAWNKSVLFAANRGKERFFAFLDLLQDPNLDSELFSIWSEKNTEPINQIQSHGISVGDTVVTEEGLVFKVDGENESDLFYWDKDLKRSNHYCVFKSNDNQELKNFRKLSESEIESLDNISENAPMKKNSEKVSNQENSESFNYEDYLEKQNNRISEEQLLNVAEAASTENE